MCLSVLHDFLAQALDLSFPRYPKSPSYSRVKRALRSD
jgi:hypothetical protein